MASSSRSWNGDGVEGKRLGQQAGPGRVAGGRWPYTCMLTLPTMPPMPAPQSQGGGEHGRAAVPGGADRHCDNSSSDLHSARALWETWGEKQCLGDCEAWRE